MLMRNVLERRRELALLRAAGYRRRHLFTMVLAENALSSADGARDRRRLRRARHRAGGIRARRPCAGGVVGRSAGPGGGHRNRVVRRRHRRGSPRPVTRRAEIGVRGTGPPSTVLARHGIARENGAYCPVIMRAVSVELPDDLFAQLGRKAKVRRVTKSWLVRESLEAGLYKQPPAGAVSCYDSARDLAGTVKKLPKDLADSTPTRR